MWNPGRPSAMFASTSTRTPSRPNTVPERALASTSPDITLVCLSALASTHGLAPFQLAQRDQALDQEVEDQYPNHNSLVAAGGGGQDSIDRIQSGGETQQHRQTADDVERNVGVAIAAPKFRIVKRLHRDPPFPDDWPMTVILAPSFAG